MQDYASCNTCTLMIVINDSVWKYDSFHVSKICVLTQKLVSWRSEASKGMPDDAKWDMEILEGQK